MKKTIFPKVSLLLAVALWLSYFHNSGAVPGTKTLLLKDHIYEDQIKTVLLYPSISSPDTNMLPAVIHLDEPNLVLEFDDLIDQGETYYAHIIHCNRDWSKSLLADLDFMNEFNEFPINTYKFSADTHIPYTHYWFNVPPVKLPGNYVIMVFRGGDREDIMLTRRFMVYEQKISFTRGGNLVGPGRVAELNQQINFTISYGNLTVLNPMMDMSVSIRQNQRWDNLAEDIKPSFLREPQHELEYRFFDPDKMFKGGSEFRFFDIRSLNNPGRNIARVDKTIKPYEVFIFQDKSRIHEAYSQYNDQNGNFIIANLDYDDLSTTNYFYANFSLAESKPINNGSVYLVGGFNYWQLSDETKMTYDPGKAEYSARILLKQGWYDYQYVVRSANLPPYYYEGSHFETENLYEVFVYYRSLRPRADLLVGYIRLEENER